MELRVPRIRVQRSEGEDFSLGTLSFSLIVGFGVHWGWIYLAMINARNLFFQGTANEVVNSWAFYTLSLTVLVLSLLSYALFSRQLRRPFKAMKFRQRVRLAGAACMAVGTLCMVFADVGSIAGVVSLVVGGVSTGIGSCVLLMSFGVSFSQCDTATIVTSTALSLFVGIGVFILVACIDVVSSLGAYVCAFLPFLECWCLHRCSSLLVDRLEFSLITLKVRKPAFAFSVCLPSALFGLALGLVRTGALNCARLTENAVVTLVAIALASLCAGILMIVAMLVQRQHLNFMFRTMLPLIGIAVAWLCLNHEENAFASTFVFFCCYVLFESMMWITYSEYSQRFRISAFVVFGFGRSSLAFGTLLAVLFAEKMTYADFLPLDEFMTVVMFCCMLVGFAVLPRGSELRNTLVGESDDNVDVDESSTAEGPGGREGDDFDGRERQKGRFKRKCEQVATTYLLSRKETEVLFLLAKGRNAAAIQEALYIAEGTARTHMRHIYKKLDVHTQQELIDLVEATDADERPRDAEAPLSPQSVRN